MVNSGQLWQALSRAPEAQATSQPSPKKLNAKPQAKPCVDPMQCLCWTPVCGAAAHLPIGAIGKPPTEGEPPKAPYNQPLAEEARLGALYEDGKLMGTPSALLNIPWRLVEREEPARPGFRVGEAERPRDAKAAEAPVAQKTHRIRNRNW